MNRSRLLQELGFPVTDSTVLVAIGFFTVLSEVARHLGIAGVLLAALLLIGLYRYALMLLEARAHGRRAPVAGVDAFNVLDNAWTLTPFILLAVAIWGSFLLHRQVSPLAGLAFVALLVAVLPASLAVLALTRSPWESLNPRAVANMIAACGPAYLLAPAAIVFGIVLVAVFAALGAPFLVQSAAGYYAVFLVYSLTGALLHARDVQFAVSIPEPLEPDASSSAAVRLKSRRAALTHAYGFFTRDNRSGGLAHLRDVLRQEGDSDEAWLWYLNEMFRWESKDAALRLAQDYLARLLNEQRDLEAAKLMSRCVMEDGRFRPLADDREAALDVLRRLRRDDLLRALDLEEPV